MRKRSAMIVMSVLGPRAKNTLIAPFLHQIGNRGCQFELLAEPRIVARQEDDLANTKHLAGCPGLPRTHLGQRLALLKRLCRDSGRALLPARHERDINGNAALRQHADRTSAAKSLVVRVRREYDYRKTAFRQVHLL